MIRFEIDHYLLGEFVKIIKFMFVKENIINQLQELRIINLLIPLLIQVPRQPRNIIHVISEVSLQKTRLKVPYTKHALVFYIKLLEDVMKDLWVSFTHHLHFDPSEQGVHPAIY